MIFMGRLIEVIAQAQSTTDINFLSSIIIYDVTSNDMEVEFKAMGASERFKPSIPLSMQVRRFY